ncbi:DUF7373 family lipoprotein [Nocardia asteroides]|uniref:Uncharacterized protein n=1 Tax=Nocardia asteroides NBRC 15531 TaxID=1110697 RepID=U5EHN8_NOCAS|nr:hypothetical protein [Nocardia asteroides]UGT51168.1 hypothetical protein LT345_11780 [Nocardia asteroides]GAD85878.1 hypothetical protein NCAST_32_03620 [Nocardia asteroides NBRC 15531]SFM33275.1 hypothetical protein SAMN05444423_102740 [Nocardia asteroides]VEG35955.1 Uncharacterised protein [Nocardia asteroides]
MVSQRFRTVLAVAAALTVLSGCVRQGEPAPQQVDLATLDVGSHGSDPMAAPTASNDKYGRVLESVRMGEVMIDPVEVDPALTYGVQERTAPLPTPLTAAGILAERVREALESHSMLAGFAVSGSDVNLYGKRPEVGASRLLTVLLLRFPDDMSARLAARQMNATDAAISPDNVDVRVEGYPGAFAHWRPNVPTMAATFAHGSFVISVLAAHTSPDQQVLTGLVRKVFDAQIPRLGDFRATPPADFDTLPLDRDGMQARLLPFGPGRWTYPTVVASDVDTNAGWSAALSVYGVVLGPRATRLMKHYGFKDPIEIVAMNDFDVLERFPDAVSARKVFDAERQAVQPTELAESPAGVPDAYCTKVRSAPASPHQAACHVLHGRYTAALTGWSPANAQQRAAAQYALLVRSE